MKTFFLFVITLMIVVCGSSAEPRHITHAEARCATNGGLKWFEVNWLHVHVIEVHCQNGASFKDRMKD